MGASNSGFQVADSASDSVHVSLERGQYHAGDTVTGYVQVQATSEMQCTDLIAYFHGETRTCVHYTTSTQEHYRENGEDKTRTHTEHHEAYQRFTFVYESRFVAHFPNDRAPPGMYQFPFNFQLHPSLPSSVYVEGQDHASIMYGVEVKLNRPGFFQPTLVHRAMFDMIAHVPHPVTPDYTMDRKAVTCCCCIGKGSITISAALERNAFRANEPVTVRVQLHNESTSEVQCVVVEVHEEACFIAEGHRAYNYCTIAEARIQERIPVGGGFGEFLGTDHKVVSISLPPFNHCSLRSPLLSITHTVRVRADTGKFLFTDPYVELPVTLHRSSTVQSAFAPPLHKGEDMQFGQPISFQLNPQAMASPIAVNMAPSAPVAPWFDASAPPQQQMGGMQQGGQPQMMQQAGQVQYAQATRQAMQQPGEYAPAMQQLSSDQGMDAPAFSGGAPAMPMDQVSAKRRKTE